GRGESEWPTARMRFADNDPWPGPIRFNEIGSHEFRITAWRDRFAGWRRDTEKKVAAGQDVSLEAIEGVHLVEAAAAQGASGAHEQDLKKLAASLASDRKSGV